MQAFFQKQSECAQSYTAAPWQNGHTGKFYVLESVSRSVMSDPLQPLQTVWPTGPAIRATLQARLLERGSHSLLRGISPTQGLNPVSALQADSWSSEPPGYIVTTVTYFSSNA